MRHVILDGSALPDQETVHASLRAQLALPEHYGNNLNALWDCLAGWTDLPVSVEWSSFGKSQVLLGEFAEDLRGVFETAARELDGFSFVVTQ